MILLDWGVIALLHVRVIGLATGKHTVVLTTSIRIVLIQELVDRHLYKGAIKPNLRLCYLPFLACQGGLFNNLEK